jgi:hypothetical protein
MSVKLCIWRECESALKKWQVPDCQSNQQILNLNQGSTGGSPTVPRSIGSLMIVR